MRNALNMGVPLRLVKLVAPPAAPESGSLFFNTTSDTVEFYDGVTWLQVEDKAHTSATYLSKVDASSTYATQEYATSIAAGLDPKQAVRAATTANLTLTYAIASDWVASTAYSEGDYISGLTAGSNPTDVFKCVVAGSSDAAEPTWDVGAVGNETVDGTATWEYVRHGGGATITNADTQAALTIDTVALAVGERVLVKDQTTTAHNGVYVVTDIGSGSTNWVMVRAEDFDGTPDNEIDGGEYTFVQGTGNENGGSTWVVISPAGATIDVGTDPIIFSQSGSSPENLLADLQLEVDTLEGSMGSAINGDGSFDPSAFAGTNYLTAVSTLTAALTTLDSQIVTNAGNISTNAGDISALEAALGSSTGLAGMDYTSTNYVTVDTSAVAAISALDAQVYNNASSLGDIDLLLGSPQLDNDLGGTNTDSGLSVGDTTAKIARSFISTGGLFVKASSDAWYNQGASGTFKAYLYSATTQNDSTAEPDTLLATSINTLNIEDLDDYSPGVPISTLHSFDFAPIQLVNGTRYFIVIQALTLSGSQFGWARSSSLANVSLIVSNDGTSWIINGNAWDARLITSEQEELGTDLGSFSGSTIEDNSSIWQAFQALDVAIGTLNAPTNYSLIGSNTVGGHLAGIDSVLGDVSTNIGNIDSILGVEAIPEQYVSVTPDGTWASVSGPWVQHITAFGDFPTGVDIPVGTFKSFGGGLFYFKLLARPGTTSPTGNITAKIYLADDSFPGYTGSALATSQPVDSSTITALGFHTEFLFPTPYPLDDGTKYAIVVDAPATGDLDIAYRSEASDWSSFDGTQQNVNQTWAVILDLAARDKPTDLGQFYGSLIPDGQTSKEAFQILETAVEANTLAISNISVSLQDAYDGGNSIITTGSNLVISGTEALQVTATGGIIADSITSSGSGITLTDGTDVLTWDSSILLRSDGANAIAEEYLDGLSLTASTIAVLAGLTVPHASWKSQIIEYSMVDGSGNQRVGRILVTTDGIDASLAHDYAETDDVLVSWSAAVNGTDLEIWYTTGANGGVTMYADVKRIRA